MKKIIPKLVIPVCISIIFLFSILFYSCTSTADNTEISAAEEAGTNSTDSYISKPRFEKPVPRPMGIYCITWSSIDNAAGYELQISESKSFSDTIRTLTVNQNHIDMELDKNRIFWLRVRAFNNDNFSGWSNPLKIKTE